MRLLIEAFHSVCQEIFHERGSPALNYAVNYAKAGVWMENGEEIRMQCLYLLNNITHWRGPTAKRCRETLKRLSKPESWKEVA